MNREKDMDTHRGINYEIYVTDIDERIALAALVHFTWGAEETEYCDTMQQAHRLARAMIDEQVMDE